MSVSPQRQVCPRSVHYDPGRLRDELSDPWCTGGRNVRSRMPRYDLSLAFSRPFQTVVRLELLSWVMSPHNQSCLFVVFTMTPDAYGMSCLTPGALVGVVYDLGCRNAISLSYFPALFQLLSG